MEAGTVHAALDFLGAHWGAIALFLGMALFGVLGEAVVDPVVLEKGLKGNFFKAYDAATPIYTDLCTEIPSNAKQEKYAWLGTAPTMREWVDERVPKGLLDHDYTLVNKHWESSIAVDRDDLEDDQLGHINMRVTDMGTRTRRHPDGLLATLVINGGSTLCYDGQYFFDTDHVEGSSGTQSNSISSTVSNTAAVTQAEFKTALVAATEKLLGYKDDRGEPFMEEWQLNDTNLRLMVPIALRQVAIDTTEAQLINNTTNTVRGLARVMTNARLTSAVEFYLFYMGAPIKPFIFQQRGFNDGQKLHIGMLGDNTETGFMRRKWVFGVDARYNMGYGLWQFAVKVTLTT